MNICILHDTRDFQKPTLKMKLLIYHSAPSIMQDQWADLRVLMGLPLGRRHSPYKKLSVEWLFFNAKKKSPVAWVYDSAGGRGWIKGGSVS